MEAGIPSYMRSTASSRAMGGEKPLKKDEKKMEEKRRVVSVPVR